MARQRSAHLFHAMTLKSTSFSLNSIDEWMYVRRRGLISSSYIKLGTDS